MDEPDADELMRAHFDHAAVGYDDWWLGTGRFAERDRPGWSAEVDQLIGVLQSLPPARVLDVACGTGFLTQHFRGRGRGAGPERSDGRDRCSTHAARAGGSGRHCTATVRRWRVRSGLYEPLLPPPGARSTRLVPRRGPSRRTEIVVVEDVRSPDAPKEEWREVDLGDGSHHRMHRHAFTAAELSAELGGGRVLHEGRWFAGCRCD